jgi:two-component system, NtrC family, response regulator GlrR
MSTRPVIEFIGEAPAFLDVLREIRGIARIDAPVLIEGETGTGKELVARALHYSGPRSDMPFIPVNCGALPESLIENEFFGHERGAYTDAREPQPGLIAQAQGGTLFLDEVDALAPRGQVALLRFLQDSRFRPLGSCGERPANVRIVAAANVDLQELVVQKRFRADLLYRLKIFALSLPSLRERPGDAELLARHFVRVYSARYATAEQPLAVADLAWIRRHSWPGNVRELENLVHRAVVQSASVRSIGGTASDATHPGNVERTHPSASGAAFGLDEFRRAKAAAIAAFERSFLERALTAAGGNVSAAARLIGKERRSLGKLMKKHGLDRAAFLGRA